MMTNRKKIKKAIVPAVFLSTVLLIPGCSSEAPNSSDSVEVVEQYSTSAIVLSGPSIYKHLQRDNQILVY